jgi:hypothetical protein
MGAVIDDVNGLLGILTELLRQARRLFVPARRLFV